MKRRRTRYLKWRMCGCDGGIESAAVTLGMNVDHLVDMMQHSRPTVAKMEKTLLTKALGQIRL